jgi:hypothetical protein
LGLLGLVLGADEPTAAKPTYELREKLDAGWQGKTKIHLVIGGKVKAEERELPLAGQALLEFAERVQEVDAEGQAKKVVRLYSDARAKFVVNNGEDPRRLRPPVRLIVGDRKEHALQLWSPGGPLTGDERELIEDVIDTTRLAGVLPKGPMVVEGNWEVDPSAICALTGVKHFIASQVKGTLVGVEDDKATVKVAGEVHGLSLGTEVKSKVDATILFRISTGLIEDVTWNQTDSRGPSPISPPGSFDVKISITRTKQAADALSDQNLAGQSLTATETSTLLAFSDPENRYRFLYDREWHITMLSSERAVLRRMKGGDFIAQLNITPIEATAKRAKMSPDHLQAMVEQAGGWKITEVIRADSVPTDGSYDLQVLMANGTSGNVKLNQKHYLTTTSSGRQVIFSFLVEPHNVDKLGEADSALMSTVQFPADSSSKNTASKEAKSPK